jgi:hypothetical protein
MPRAGINEKAVRCFMPAPPADRLIDALSLAEAQIAPEAT